MVGGIVKIYIGPFLFLNGMHMRLINCSQINTHLLILGLGNACLLPKLAKKNVFSFMTFFHIVKNTCMHLLAKWNNV